MNFLGMGTMEIIVVALIAFIFLGPQRIVGVARLLGKAARQVRQATAELPDLVGEIEADPPDVPTAQGGGPLAIAPSRSPQAHEPPQSGEAGAGGSGPVAFQPDRRDSSQGDPGPLA